MCTNLQQRAFSMMHHQRTAQQCRPFLMYGTMEVDCRIVCCPHACSEVAQHSIKLASHTLFTALLGVPTWAALWYIGSCKGVFFWSHAAMVDGSHWLPSFVVRTLLAIGGSCLLASLCGSDWRVAVALLSLRCLQLF